MSGLLDAWAVEVLGLVLLHSSWQGLLVGVVAAAILSFARSPTARYRWACLALFALLALPILTGLHLSSRGPTDRSLAAVTFGANGTIDPVGTSWSTAAGTDVGAFSPRVREPVTSGSAADASRGPRLELLQGRLATVLVIVWSLGVLIGLIRLVTGLLWVSRWRANARRPAPVVVGTVRALARSMEIRARVVVLEAARLAAPVVVGVVRPVVLVPVGISSTLPPAQLEAVLAHELAHVVRRDYLVNLLQRLAETFLFHHPVAWWLSGVVRLEREHLCDELAVRAVGGNPLHLAQALATLEGRRRDVSTPAVAARGDGSVQGDLVGRVARLLGRDRRRSAGAGAPLVLQAALPAVLLGLSALAGPAVAQVQSGSSVLVSGRYGTLTVAGEDVPRAYVQLTRTAAASGARFEHRLIDPFGSLRSAHAWEVGTESWSERFELNVPGTWTLEIVDGAREDTARLNLPLASEVELEPVRHSVDDGTRHYGGASPIYGEDGQVMDWEFRPSEPGPYVFWDPVPGAAAYYVNIEPAGEAASLSPIHPQGERLLPAESTRYSLASLPAGEYVLRVHAFSADPRVDPGEGGLRRVDESVSRMRRYRSERRPTAPDLPEGDEGSATEPVVIALGYGSTLGLATESVEVSVGWVKGRLRAQLPVVEGSEQWDLILSTAGGIERMRVAAPRIRVQVDGSAREADIAGAQDLIPHVPYVLEARALPSAFEGEPPNFTEVLSIGRVQPIYAPR